MSTTVQRIAQSVAALPSLTDHPRYAAALKRRTEIAAHADPFTAELIEVRLEIAARDKAAREARERKAAGQSAPSPTEIAADALLAGDPNPTRLATKSRNELAWRAEELENELVVVATALRKFDSAEVNPARQEAFNKFVPVAWREVWQPLIRQAAMTLVHYQRIKKTVTEVAVALQAKELFGGPIASPLPYHDFGPIDSEYSQVAGLVKALIADGYVSKGEVEFSDVKTG